MCFEQLLTKNDTHEYANIALKFIAKYLSSYDSEEAHPTMTAMFEYILEVRQNSLFNARRIGVTRRNIFIRTADKSAANRSISHVWIR